MQASTQKCRQTDRKQKQHTHKHTYTHAYTFNSQLIKKPSTLGVCAAECACICVCVLRVVFITFVSRNFQTCQNSCNHSARTPFPPPPSYPLRPLVMTPHEAPESVTCAICCLFTFTANAFFTAFS